MEVTAILHGARTLPEKSSRHPAKGLTLRGGVYIRRGMGRGMLFSRILLDLVGRKISGQKGTDSINGGQVQGNGFCDKHIKTSFPARHSARPATVLARDLGILLPLGTSPGLLAKRPGAP